MSDRLFLDTAYPLALLNRRDQHHNAAKSLFERVQSAQEVWTTEAVLLEVGDALSRLSRSAAAGFIRNCYAEKNMRIESVSTQLLRAVDLYERRSDKTWGLTDCLSFVVMQDNGLTDALTADDHFRQAGYRVLLQR